MAALMADAEIAALHAEAVAAHIAKRDALLAQPEYQQMQAQLRAASKLPPQEQALIAALGLEPVT